MALSQPLQTWIPVPSVMTTRGGLCLGSSGIWEPLRGCNDIILSASHNLHCNLLLLWKSLDFITSVSSHASKGTSFASSFFLLFPVLCFFLGGSFDVFFFSGGNVNFVAGYLCLVFFLGRNHVGLSASLASCSSASSLDRISTKSSPILHFSPCHVKSAFHPFPSDFSMFLLNLNNFLFCRIIEAASYLAACTSLIVLVLHPAFPCSLRLTPGRPPPQNGPNICLHHLFHQSIQLSISG